VVKSDDPAAYAYVHLQQTANDTPNGPFATRHVVPEVKFEKKRPSTFKQLYIMRTSAQLAIVSVPIYICVLY